MSVGLKAPGDGTDGEDMSGETEADRQLRALVALIEGQAEQLVTLRRAVAELSGRLAIRSDLDALVARQLEDPVDELNEVIRSLRDASPDTERLLAHADEQVGHLRAVAADLLGPDGWGEPPIARSQLGRVELASIVERAIHVGQLGARATRLTLHIEPGLALMTSSPRLVAILVNLLDRATRRSADGGAELRAWTLEPGLVRIEVSDRGPIFAPDDPEAALSREKSGPTLEPDPRVLGLHLVRLLAWSLGGNAWVTNGQLAGTVVTVDLPQRRQKD